MSGAGLRAVLLSHRRHTNHVRPRLKSLHSSEFSEPRICNHKRVQFAPQLCVHSWRRGHTKCDDGLKPNRLPATAKQISCRSASFQFQECQPKGPKSSRNSWVLWVPSPPPQAPPTPAAPQPPPPPRLLPPPSAAGGAHHQDQRLGEDSGPGGVGRAGRRWGIAGGRLVRIQFGMGIGVPFLG